MKRALMVLIFLGAAVGCGRSTPPPAPPTPPAEVAAPSVAQKAAEAVGGAAGLTMSGIKLFLYDKGAGFDGVARKPVLRIEADTFTSVGEKSWSFQKARAFMLSRKTQEEWELEAEQGVLQEDQSAFLQGGVTARLGTMTVHLEDISFETPQDDAPKAAFSDKPVTVEDPAMQLRASTVKLFPDDKRFELTEVSGSFLFEVEKTAAAAGLPVPDGSADPGAPKETP